MKAYESQKDYEESEEIKMKPLSEYAKDLQEDIKIIEQLNKDLTDPRWLKPRIRDYKDIYEGSGVLNDPTQR